jgi:outer membrane protein OmpA-like peptidoglycan-associated protein
MKTRLSFLFIVITFSAFSQQISPRYELVKMDKNVNTFHHEAAPVVSPDGTTLYFFVQDHPENTMGKDDTQDIWMSKKDEKGAWSPAQHLSSPFNNHRSNQVFTVLPDGDIFIKGGKTRGEKGFSIARSGGGLTELDVKDFKKMNNGRFYGASMSSDRKHIIIYFSEIENSQNSDIYGSHLQNDGSYSRPVKIAKLTTSLDDVGPFIGPDQKTLFFGSARQSPGRQGGVDIYKTTRLDDTWMNWSEPINMGKPINTSALDYYFTTDAAGNVFTSRANKALEGAQLDLYMLVPKTVKVNLVGTVLNQKTRDPLSAANVSVSIKEKEPVSLKSTASGEFKTTLPEISEYAVSVNATGFLPKEQSFKVPKLNNDTTINIEMLLTPVAKALVLAGNVYDKKTEKPLNARLTITQKAGRKNLAPLQTTDGKYEQVVPQLGWYILVASAEGYLNATDSVSFDNDDNTPMSKDIYMQPIEVGLTVRLNHIYFDFDKTTLKTQSYTELNKVVDFLKRNQTVEIEIAGHTDNKGTDEYNRTLSQGRCQAVVDYLVSQGIDSGRLTPKGYGESKPIDTNDTPDGQANNRRVEITVLKT